MVGTADRSIICMNLDPQPQMARKDETQLKYQYHCLTIFRDKVCNQPTGYTLDSIEECMYMHKNYTYVGAFMECIYYILHNLWIKFMYDHHIFAKFIY